MNRSYTQDQEALPPFDSLLLPFLVLSLTLLSFFFDFFFFFFFFVLVLMILDPSFSSFSFLLF